MWLKLDAAFYGHPKIMLAGRDARDLYGAGLCWSAFYMTDGFLPVSCLARLGADAAGGDGATIDTAAAVQRLLAIGLWETAQGGYHIHDYLKHQTSRTKMRATAKSRAHAGAAGGAANGKQNGSKSEANVEATPKQTASNAASKTASKNEADKELDLDSDYIKRAPLPPTPLVSVQPDARGPDSAGTLTLEAMLRSAPASLHAAPGEARGARERGGASRGHEHSRRMPATPVPARPSGVPDAAQRVPLRAIPKPCEVERAAIEAHPLYEPLAEQFGPVTTRDLDAWRDDLAALDEMDARPEDIPRAAVGYAAMMGHDPTGRPIAMTRRALIKHWYSSLHAPEPAAWAPADTALAFPSFEAPIVVAERRRLAGYAP